MNSRKTVFLLILSLAAAVPLFPQDAATIPGVKAICANFLKHAAADDYGTAFSYLREQPNCISAENFAELEGLAVQQADTIRQAYGNAIDVRLVKEELAGDFILKLVYVVRREKHIIRWQFIYYKAAADWKLDAISFDDDISAVF
jgi:hypothetical protein